MEPSSQPAQTEGIYCSSCGTFNPDWRTHCERCGAYLMKTGQQARKYLPERPGCLTAYAILTWIGAGFSILAGLIFSGLMFTDTDLIAIGCLVGPLVIIFGVLYIFLGLGLWNQKNWARIVVIVLQSLGIAATLFQVCLLVLLSSSYGSLYGYGDSTWLSICSTVIGLAVSGYILYWFATNGDYFG